LASSFLEPADFGGDGASLGFVGGDLSAFACGWGAGAAAILLLNVGFVGVAATGTGLALLSGAGDLFLDNYRRKRKDQGLRI
jgi:hypothetical protein